MDSTVTTNVVLGALGVSVAWLYIRFAMREATCEARLNLSFRRQRATWNKLIEVATNAGVAVNGEYADEMAEIDAEEDRLLKRGAR